MTEPAPPLTSGASASPQEASPQQASPQPQTASSSRGRLIVLALVIAGSFLIAWATGVTERVTKDSIRAFVLDAGAWGALAFVVAFCVGELLHIPGMLFVFVGILIWGPVAGGALGYGTAVLSVSFTFVLVRLIGGQPAGRLRWRVVTWALAQLDTRPVLTVAVLRVLFQMNPPINYALALSSVRFRDYLLGSALGLAPPLALLSLLWEQLPRWFPSLFR